FGTAGTDISAQRDAENLLKEYQKYSNKLQVQFVNPDLAPAQASRYGLTRYDVVVFDNGVRHETADSTSEENFTGALLRLRSSTQKTVAIQNVPSVLDFSGSSQQAVAATLARKGLDTENYTVLPTYNLVVSPTISVTDVNVMIVPPSPENQPLPDNAVRALLDYLDRGGHVLLIGDPLAAPLPAALLQKYGLSEARGIIVDQDRNSLWGNSPTQLVALSYPSSTITRDMNNVPTIYGAAEPIVVATTTITGFTTTPYIQSSSTAQYAVIKADASGNQTQLALDPNGPQAPMNIGVTVEQTVADTGNFTSTETTKPQVTRLAVIGDYDMLSDQLISQAPGNLDMFNNTVNWLSQSEERISVRPKDTTPRQLTMTEQQQSLIAWSTIVFLPVLVLLGGGLVWWRRR
ncbi:MAG: Gldg family protein, partial [Thermomicrobiales bacterium]